MELVTDPTESEVEQAKLDYERSLGVLLAAQRAAAAETGKALVGKCFKSDAIYIAITGQDAEGLIGWRFHESGQQVVVSDEKAIDSSFAESWVEVTRTEFVTAFNLLLSAVARYVDRIPA